MSACHATARSGLALVSALAVSDGPLTTIALSARRPWVAAPYTHVTTGSRCTALVPGERPDRRRRPSAGRANRRRRYADGLRCQLDRAGTRCRQRNDWPRRCGRRCGRRAGSRIPWLPDERAHDHDRAHEHDQRGAPAAPHALCRQLVLRRRPEVTSHPLCTPAIWHCRTKPAAHIEFDYPMATYDPTTALLVVDVQNDFADPEGSLYVKGGEAAVPFINARDRAAPSRLGRPSSTPRIGIPSRRRTSRRTAASGPSTAWQGTWGAELHPDLLVSGPVVRKGSNGEDGYSGFTMRDPVSGDTMATPAGGHARAARA